MPLESLICRRKLDEERGNPWICNCLMCREARKEEQIETGGPGKEEEVDDERDRGTVP